MIGIKEPTSKSLKMTIYDRKRSAITQSWAHIHDRTIPQ